MEVFVGIENETVVAVHPTGRTEFEFLLVCESGGVFLFDSFSRRTGSLPALTFPVRHAEYHFELWRLQGQGKSFLQIISSGHYVCITQRYGLNGVVLSLTDHNFRKDLVRVDYHAEFCTFPIAFYSENENTFLIHGSDWNRIDITHLESDKLITDRVVDQPTNSNYFDYFHSSISVSPDSEHFTSNGWVWSPYDVITVYPTQEFLTRYELAHTAINFEPVDGYNWDRPMCWIDNRTIGIGYNRKEDGESSGDFPSEVIFVDILSNQIIGRIDFDGFALSNEGAAQGHLFYDMEREWLIGLNHQSGLLISDINGSVLDSDNSLIHFDYSAKYGLLYGLNSESQSIQLKSI